MQSKVVSSLTAFEVLWQPETPEGNQRKGFHLPPPFPIQQQLGSWAQLVHETQRGRQQAVLLKRGLPATIRRGDCQCLAWKGLLREHWNWQAAFGVCLPELKGPNKGFGTGQGAPAQPRWPTVWSFQWSNGKRQPSGRERR